MQFKVTKSDGATEYCNETFLPNLENLFKNGRILRVETACIFEALPYTVVLDQGEFSVSEISRVGFCKMVAIYTKESKIPAIKWVRGITGWGLMDAKNLVDYCVEMYGTF